jgi:hypothetical protein
MFSFKVMTLEGGCPWWSLGLPLWMELVPLGKKVQESSVTLSITWGHNKNRITYEPENTFTGHQICWCFDLELLSLQNCEKYISLVYKLLRLW